MNKFLAIVLLFVLGPFAFGSLNIGGWMREPATCTPSGSGACKACKNCKYCKNCAKNGGTCTVCNPPKPPKPH